MDHPFQSRRGEAEKAEREARFCKACVAVLSLGEKDRAKMRERREVEVECEVAKEGLVSVLAGRLGNVVRDLRRAVEEEGGADESTAQSFKLYEKEWEKYLCSSQKADASNLLSFVKKRKEEVDARARRARAFDEMDDGSSSCSDYSDSDTDSSRSSTTASETLSRRRRSGSTEEESGEEEEESEEESESGEEEEEESEEESESVEEEEEESEEEKKEEKKEETKEGGGEGSATTSGVRPLWKKVADMRKRKRGGGRHGKK